jgi:hypothetical protein
MIAGATMHLVHNVLSMAGFMGIMSFPVLFLVSTFAGNDAVHYYNIYQRQKDLPELPMGVFSLRDSMQFLWTCALPDDMSPLIRSFIQRYRLWVGLFFTDLLLIPFLFFLAGNLS